MMKPRWKAKKILFRTIEFCYENVLNLDFDRVFVGVIMFGY